MAREREDEIVHEKLEAILRTIIQQAYNRPEQDAAAKALLCFLIREANTWRSICLLRRHSLEPTAFMVDAGTLLRAMFDACFQAELIFRDPARRAELAIQYFDFAHVEQYKSMQNVLSHDNSLTNVLRSSPKRPEGEKRLREEFDRVKDSFSVERKHIDGAEGRDPRTREKWYKGGLRELARAAGKEAEYDTFVTGFSGCVHSSALAVNQGPNVDPDSIILLASTIAARVAAINAEYHQLEIGEDRMILEELSRNWV